MTKLYFSDFKFVLVFLSLITGLAWGSEKNFDHSAWNKILHHSVIFKKHKSLVNYSMIKDKLQDEFDHYLNELSSVSREDFQKYSDSEKLAFLINAYNAFTVKLILNHYPVDSIKDIKNEVPERKRSFWSKLKEMSPFSTPWKINFITLFGEKVSLDKIEHQMIRENFKEPRIHFAVVCASKSCPPLLEKAYTGSKLEELLDFATNNFLQDKDRNIFEAKSSTLKLSKILKWYAQDFGELEGVKRLAIEKMNKKDVDIEKISVEYFDYDWSLNDYTI